jgi:hypothetical protein
MLSLLLHVQYYNIVYVHVLNVRSCHECLGCLHIRVLQVPRLICSVVHWEETNIGAAVSLVLYIAASNIMCNI